jgi:hypothetical protein
LPDSDLEARGCDCLSGGSRAAEHLGDTLLVMKVDLARPTSDLYRMVSTFADKGVAFKVFPATDKAGAIGRCPLMALSGRGDPVGECLL